MSAVSAPSLSPSARYDAVMLDLDGTLVDTLDDFVAVLAATLQALELPPVAPAFVARTIGRGSEYLIRRTLEEVGAPPGRYDEAWALYQQHYDRVNGKHARVFDGVPEGLVRLRGHGLRLACLTNKPGRFAQDLLQRMDLAGHFEHVFGGDAFARKKPDPLPLLETCKALGSEPARTLMVGDSSNDAHAAHAAGCPVVLVSYGYNHGEPIAAVAAAAHIDRLDQLQLG